MKWKSSVRENKSFLGRHRCACVLNLKLMKVGKLPCGRTHDVAFGVEKMSQIKKKCFFKHNASFKI